MVKITHISDSSPSPHRIKCDRCGAFSGFPVCPDCQRPFGAQKAKAFNEEKRREALQDSVDQLLGNAVAKSTNTPPSRTVRVPSPPDRVPRYQRRREQRERFQLDRRRRRDNSALDQFQAKINEELSAKLTTIRSERSTGADLISRWYKKAGKARAEAVLEQVWARRQARVDNYIAATSLPFVSMELIEKWERDVELERRKKEGR